MALNPTITSQIQATICPSSSSAVHFSHSESTVGHERTKVPSPAPTHTHTHTHTQIHIHMCVLRASVCVHRCSDTDSILNHNNKPTDRPTDRPTDQSSSFPICIAMCTDAFRVDQDGRIALHLLRKETTPTDCRELIQLNPHAARKIDIHGQTVSSVGRIGG